MEIRFTPITIPLCQSMQLDKEVGGYILREFEIDGVKTGSFAPKREIESTSRALRDNIRHFLSKGLSIQEVLSKLQGVS